MRQLDICADVWKYTDFLRVREDGAILIVPGSCAKGVESLGTEQRQLPVDDGGIHRDIRVPVQDVKGRATELERDLWEGLVRPDGVDGSHQNALLGLEVGGREELVAPPQLQDRSSPVSCHRLHAVTLLYAIPASRHVYRDAVLGGVAEERGGVELLQARVVHVGGAQIHLDGEADGVDETLLPPHRLPSQSRRVGVRAAVRVQDRTRKHAERCFSLLVEGRLVNAMNLCSQSIAE
mmetsp:Transcript_12659/g.29120  ORF Transcript_12659/g.29120 Transcript_12659/m.29120 type:complete len:236 (-) Transcript_12659:2981-3688(-)